MDGAAAMSLSPAIYGNGHVANGDMDIEHAFLWVIEQLGALRADVDALKEANNKHGIYLTKDVRGRVDSPLASPAPMPANEQTVEALDTNLSTPGSVATASKMTKPSIPGDWKPLYISTLKDLGESTFPGPHDMASFSYDFLMRMFNGAIEHSPGIWYIPKAAGGSLLPDRTLYLMNSTTEPYLPTAPTGHGAKLTAFYNPNDPSDGVEISTEDVPLFVSASAWGGKARKNNEYLYMGMYSQTRWSDKLDLDTMTAHVPQHVKEHHAQQLASPARPEWVTDALMKHFWPMPQYDGLLPTVTPNGSAVADEGADEKFQKKFKKCVEEYIEDLSVWRSDATTQVGLISKDNILKAFETADADLPPGLRLYWEYLECKKWDGEFYDLLMREQSKFNRRR